MSGRDDTPPPEVEEGRQARPETPVLRIVTPDTTPEEVAAIVAVLAALGAADDRPAARRTSEWNRPSRLTRVAHRHGPGAWVASGLPR
ncbi:MAG TPA: acyl-CoA carboxylase epsilon subunit [Nocardioides sp.]|nr:acyl-CoA carboxylase epsilon subunit [Nocardioides sp.]